MTVSIQVLCIHYLLVIIYLNAFVIYINKAVTKLWCFSSQSFLEKSIQARAKILEHTAKIRLEVKEQVAFKQANMNFKGNW